MRYRYLIAIVADLTACASPDAQHAVPPTAGAAHPVPALARPAPIAPQKYASLPLSRATSGPRPVVSPTTYANATATAGADIDDLPGTEAPEGLRPALAEADATDLGSAQTAQTFWLRPDRDTVVFGAEGTAIAIPAQAFTEASGSASTGPIELLLKEFYSLPDILLNNLSTNSSYGLLETGGMLHLAARAANGQPCTLRPGTELLIRMPAPQLKAGMQLFAGVHTGGQGLDWQRPRPALAPADFERIGPIAPGGEGPLLAFLRQKLAFSAEAAQHLRAAQTRPQRRELRRVRRFTGRRWVDYGRLVVAVDRRGTVVNAAVAGLRDSVLQVQLCAAARQLPAFRPAALRGPVRRQPATAVRSYLTISRKRRTAPAPLPQLPVAGTWTVEVGFSRDGRVWFPGLSTSYVNEPGDGRQQVFQADTARQRLRRAGTRALQAASLDTLSGYLFSAASLGWANCDRAGQFGSQRIQYTVQTDAPGTRVNLVFKRVRTVVGSDGERPGSQLQQFHSSPVGEAATLVAIKRENGVTYLALKDVVLGERVERDLPFQPVSAAELRTALARIDQ